MGLFLPDCYTSAATPELFQKSVDCLQWKMNTILELGMLFGVVMSTAVVVAYLVHRKNKGQYVDKARLKKGDKK